MEIILNKAERLKRIKEIVDEYFENLKTENQYTVVCDTRINNISDLAQGKLTVTIKTTPKKE